MSCMRVRSALMVSTVAGWLAIAGWIDSAHAQPKQWKGWAQIQTFGATDVAVNALTGLNAGRDAIHAYKVKDNLAWHATLTDFSSGRGWSPWERVEPAQGLASIAVQGGYLTDATVASAPALDPLGKDDVSVFYKDVKGRIRFGSGEEVGGGGVTDAAPCAIRDGNVLRLFVKGLDNHIYTNSRTMWPEVKAWSGWTVLPAGDVEGTTDVALAGTVASYGTPQETTVYLFAKGINDQQVYVNTLHNTWSGWSIIPGDLTTDAPLSATTGTDYVYLFAKRTDGKVFMNSLHTPTSPPSLLPPSQRGWRGWEELPGFTTDAALAAAVFGGKLFLFGKGADKLVYLNEEQ